MSEKTSATHEGGIVVRGPDGALYFLRDHVLEQAKMGANRSKDAEKLFHKPDLDTKNFKVENAAPEFKALGRVEVNIGSRVKVTENMRAMSTVMCPSFLFTPGGTIDKE